MTRLLGRLLFRVKSALYLRDRATLWQRRKPALIGHETTEYIFHLRHIGPMRFDNQFGATIFSVAIEELS